METTFWIFTRLGSLFATIIPPNLRGISPKPPNKAAGWHDLWQYFRTFAAPFKKAAGFYHVIF